jgi:putative hydrolases of HD superfamily
MDSLQEIMDFTAYAEGLKRELRNSFLSNGRQESVADHSWRMALMAMLIAPKTKLNLNMEKILKMILIHDLVEIEAGNIPTTEQTPEVLVQKDINEQRAIETIRKKLKNTSGEEIYLLWNEFEDLKTPEAIFAKIMDKVECIIQKNQQTIDRSEGEPGYFKKLSELGKIDSFLSSICESAIEKAGERDRKNQLWATNKT